MVMEIITMQIIEAMDKKVAVEAQVLGSNAPFQFRYHPIL